jgi:energy-converting hydrogenase Eha subunit A
LNQYRILYFKIIIRRNSEHVTGCIGVEEIPKKRTKHLAWNIFKSWWRPFLSHVLVFFVFNQYRIFYFTIILRRNSVHVTSCIGIEEIPKKRPKHLAWNISKSRWRPFLSHIMVFFILNQWRILCFKIIIRENSLYVPGCIGVEEIPKKRPKYLAWNISKSWWTPFLSHVLVFFVLNQYRILYFKIIIRRNSEHVPGCIGVEEIPKKCTKHLAWNISKSWWRPFLSYIMVFFMLN